MRVATMRLFSCGALAMVNVRVFPSASVSGGASRVRSIAWPASNVQSVGFSNRKAIVPSAISWRPASFDVVVTRLGSIEECSLSGATSEQVQHQGNYRNDQHQMNQPPSDVKGEKPKHPQHQIGRASCRERDQI